VRFVAGTAPQKRGIKDPAALVNHRNISQKWIARFRG
jgi:hypothetical protein